MKVLVFTSLYPNNIKTDNGVFIKNRMVAFSKIKDCEVKVVAPVPYCPPLKSLEKFYQSYRKIKSKELIDDIEVYHPRYFLIPKISMPFHGLFIFLFTFFTLKKI
ncbi:MAG: glycosyltransferase family 4 protein, partial [Candidatus Muiribacteriota bacterium]